MRSFGAIALRGSQNIRCLRRDLEEGMRLAIDAKSSKVADYPLIRGANS